MRLSKEICDDIIRSAEEKSDWNYVSYKNKDSYNITTVEIDPNITSIVKKYCLDHLNVKLGRVNMSVLKYNVGDLFSRHIDYSSTSDNHKDFIYNVNVRLNDNYEGGEFWLNDKPYNQPIGELYHYRSTEYHEVKVITKGVRYSALFYVRERDIKDKEKTLF